MWTEENIQKFVDHVTLYHKMSFGVLQIYFFPNKPVSNLPTVQNLQWDKYVLGSINLKVVRRIIYFWEIQSWKLVKKNSALSLATISLHSWNLVKWSRNVFAKIFSSLNIVALLFLHFCWVSLGIGKSYKADCKPHLNLLVIQLASQQFSLLIIK